MSFKLVIPAKRSGRVMTRILPLLIWMIALAGVVALYIYRTASFHVVGVATAQTRDMAVTESGILVSLPVQLYQEVRQGEILARLRMNTASQNQYTAALLEAQKATAEAELERLKSEYLAMEQQVSTSLAQEDTDLAFRNRQLALDIERLRIKILEIQMSLEPGKIQLNDLELEKKVLRELLDKKAIDAYELQKVEVQHQILSEKIRWEEERLSQTRNDLLQAQRRLADFVTYRPSISSIQVLLDPLRRAIDVQEKKLAELFLPGTEIIITAPFDGVISGIRYLEGQAVLQGESILSVTAKKPDHVIVWVEQEVCGTLHEQQNVQVVKTTYPRQIMMSRISHIGPMIELKPDRLWKNPSVPEWGRPVIIPIHPDMQLIPNELVGIRRI
ncbi:MAG: HlyD family efflux transporter periplasmic adaptor subunit [Sedimentisphaerales bacterium]|nr:HlyD family efflux transporter periplasmic adaptor subunit [Sedimentisphaerales bacterium]